MEKRRIDYIDGLRAVAVLMVVFQHAAVFWSYQPSGQMARRLGSAYWWITGQGHEGVTLFLVISGFSLSVKPWRKCLAGESNWFSVKEFAWGRCRRILPPYYVALALCILLDVLLGSHGLRPALGLPVSAANIEAHVLLIHNMTPFISSINAPFWSLGLEWQWYFMFPAVLLACRRRLAAVLTVTLTIALAWHILTDDLWLAYTGVSAALPACLFEFAVGVGVARIVVAGALLRRRQLASLWAALLLPLVLGILPNFSRGLTFIFGQVQPLWAVAFGALLLLGAQVPLLGNTLSWKPLTRIGTWSYSIYLVHVPVIRLVGTFGPRMPEWWPFYIVAAPVLGVLGGIAFYFGVERQFLSARSMRPLVAAPQPQSARL